MALPGRFKAIALTTGSPTLSAPDMYVYRAPPIEFFDGQVEVVSDWQLGDPEVWPLNSLKLDPEDGVPIKEALFSRHNADMAISVDGQSLVGRSALARGPAHRIKVQAPLTFAGRILGLDPAFKPGGGDVPPTVAFRAHMNGINQTISGGTHTKLLLAVEDYDQGGCFNLALGRWTPPLGLIHVDAQVYFAGGLSAGSYVIAAIFKNGGLFKQGVNVASSSSNGGYQISLDDVANGTDYYEFFGYGGNIGSSPVVDGSNTFFCGHVPSGQQGVQGIQGPIGLTGPIGPQGIQGIQGLIGLTGPQGQQGIQGPQGVQGNVGSRGPTGDQGNPGALWYQGAGAPAAGIGIIGDFYLRISTGDVYQKTGVSTWGLIGNIKGPQGAQGIQGNTGADSTVPGPKGDVGTLWYDGAGAPAGALGRDGDYYLNRTTGDVYLRTAGTWSVVGSIKGPQGIQGIQGVVGPQGSVWYSGTSNPTAGTGVDGDYYFNNSTQAFWKKTAGAWAQIANLASGSQAIGFHAYKTATQSVTANTSTKVTFEIEVYDNGSFYDTGLHRWTPPAGLVHIDATIIATGMNPSVGCVVELWKNGVIFRSASNVSSIGSDGTQISVDDNASGTNYYEIYVRLSGSPSASGGQACFWSGHVIGPQGPRGDTGPVSTVPGPQGPQGPAGSASTVPGPVGPPATYPTGAHGFTAQKTVDQAIASNTWTKVDFNSENYDTGGQYDAGSTSRYTPVAGDAFFVASVYCSGTVVGGNIYLAIYKNGAIFRAATSNNTNGSAQIVCADNANGTDYYETWVYATATGASFTIPASEINLLFFQGFQPVGPTGPQGPAGFGIVQIGATPPASPSVGNFWYDTSTGILSVWINDGSSSQWIQVSPTINLDLSNYVGINSPAFLGTPTAPTAPAGTNTTQVATTAFVASEAVRHDAAQTLTAAQQLQARTNIYAAPLDAIAYNGLQYNGGMEISQERGTTPTTATGTYILDGFNLDNTDPAPAVSAGQVVDAPPGLVNSIKLTVTTAVPTLAASTVTRIMHRVEGYRASRLAWGYASAQPIAIGFWSKIHRPGTYAIAVRNAAANRCYITTFTHNVADAWEWKTLTVPGDTTGPTSFTGGNSICFAVNFVVAAGPTFAAPSANSWNTGNFLTVAGATNGVAATTDTYQIAGLIVVPGLDLPSADRAPLIMRPYDQEKWLCRRYFVYDAYSGSQVWTHPLDITSQYRRRTHYFIPEMRAAPTCTITSIGVAAVIGQITPTVAEINGDGASYTYITSIKADARL